MRVFYFFDFARFFCVFLQPESLYETPPVISDSIMFTVAVAYSRLIQTSFEERLDDLTDVAADLVQPTQLILQVVHSSPE